MTRKPFRIDGVRILITGASSGIGRALAVALSREGARLALVARRRPLLESLGDSIASEGHERPLLHCADLGVPGAGVAAAREAEATLGGIDVLINNAGTSITAAQHLIGDGPQARRLFETNYWSPLALVAALTPGMRQRSQGVVVNVTSTLQSVPMPQVGYYVASKSALARATQVMRHELRDSGIHVIEMVPGGTDTETRGQDKDLPLRPGKKLPKPPLVSPEQAARAIVQGLRKKTDRVVYPASSLVPLELPAAGRLIGNLAAGFIDAGFERKRTS
ncbi:SDR family NAD(P)-dependent oxidoreductase [Solimonas sp. K1W22B-7]|uniref:SDR family NAD(P)-dependent oxidoreductase n=1 Tax=Solimonas sp. K1W22B-7 TaxID=2303331 RepID=UPI000E32E5BC|nr:SDR family NAD(P)-dependent oxidoreductase [Solimonas sp. K1W22B-7]AXQ30341.1 SDR family NAD(P)-dependent oxidoreductase [Solimonas sp. K1W22B-7]